MRGVFVASRKGGDGVQGAPAPSPRCDYRLDIARARLHTHTHMGQVPETTQARAMRGVFVASLMGGAQATLYRHRQAQGVALFVISMLSAI